MKVDADVIFRVHIHDGQPDAEDSQEDKDLLTRINGDPDDFKKRFTEYMDNIAKERFVDEIADGYFDVSTEVERVEVGATEG